MPKTPSKEPENKAESFSHYLDRIMRDEGLSSYDVERRSGNGVSQTQVSRLQRGENKNPTTKTLAAIAKGIGRPEEEVFAVARGLTKQPDIKHERLLSIDSAYDKLPLEERGNIDNLLDIIEREVARLLAANRSKS